jgi:hypothetical protein
MASLVHGVPATINTATARELLLIHLRPLLVSVLFHLPMSIVITPEVTPTFTQVGPLCQNSHCTNSYHVLLIMASLVHGVLLLLILQLQELLLIHLLQAAGQCALQLL